MAGPVDFFPTFNKNDLLVLAGEYRAGTVLEWDPLRLLDELLLGPATPEMFVLAWEISMLHTNLVVVVAPGTENSWILRVVLTPEFLWLGLHWAGLPYPAQLTDYSTHLLPILHSHHLVASMALHYNMGVSNRWWELNHHLGLYLSPAASAKQATVPAMEDIMPMEGIEASAGVSVPTVGNSVREYSPDMDICSERGVSSVAPAPAAAAPAPPMVHTSVREYSPGMDICEEPGVPSAASAPLTPAALTSAAAPAPATPVAAITSTAASSPVNPPTATSTAAPAPAPSTPPPSSVRAGGKPLRLRVPRSRALGSCTLEVSSLLLPDD
ncbi:uncharacterized protein N7515_002185 [Penicillium bovifimosum]|uniref:Uncharacterized protein n=1 Tax=Penicillium bovifimosum TaxID=126998 RepID=A0A9W9HBA1_9EURO|nr:uncharacterized protein N7515_002185 [Penicillium bovifimosum]KAJ5143398.1 hypothetical protein N7515_002185 [Penicillium bovifimosum]